MTFGEQQKEVRRRLNELTATFWTDQDIKDALNEGYEEISDASEWFERYANIPMLSGRTYYNLLNILPDTFLSPRRCFNTVTNRWLQPTDTRQQDFQAFVQWETNSGQPEKYIFRGNWWLGVWPKRSADDGILRFYYSAIPPAMADDSDTPGFLDEFHSGLVDFALSDLLSQDRETNKAMAFWASYKAQETGLAQYVNGRTAFDRAEMLS